MSLREILIIILIIIDIIGIIFLYKMWRKKK